MVFEYSAISLFPDGPSDKARDELPYVIENLALIRVRVPVAYGSRYVPIRTCLFLTTKLNFLPDIICKWAMIPKVFNGFFFFFAVETYGGACEISFPQVIPG